jgi:ABC-type Fe3+-citrate transport system substrate-binding protein
LEKEKNHVVVPFTKSYYAEVIGKRRANVLILVSTQDGYQVASEDSYFGSLVNNLEYEITGTMYELK